MDIVSILNKNDGLVSYRFRIDADISPCKRQTEIKHLSVGNSGLGTDKKTQQQIKQIQKLQ